MAYNPYESASNILNLKGQWEKAGDEEKKKIAASAREHYNNLLNNGYGDVANKLQNSDYGQAQSVVNGVGKSGKIPGRKYITDILTGKYGMSQASANDAITWDADSGDVFLGGNNIGKGDVLIDGTNYYNDTANIDDALGKYVKNTGKTITPDIRYDVGKNSFSEKFDQNWGMKMGDHDLFASNALLTPDGQAIMEDWLRKGDVGGYNEIASGAGANGGNVDSYSMANARRQIESAKINGQNAAIAANQARLQSLLGYYGSNTNDLGLLQADNQQTFDNGETAKNNQMDRYGKESSITGSVPNPLANSNNPYLNSDGTVKDVYLSEEFDNAGGFKGLLERTTDPEARALIEQARTAKVQLPNWWKYAADTSAVAPQQSAAIKQANADRDLEYHTVDTQSGDTRYGIDSQERLGDRAEDNNLKAIESGERIANGGYATDLAKTQSNNAAAVAVNQSGTSGSGTSVPKLSAAQATSAIKNGEITQAVVDAYNYHYGTDYTADGLRRQQADDNNVKSALNSYAGTKGLKIASLPQADIARVILKTASSDEAADRLLKEYGIPDDVISSVAASMNFYSMFNN